MTVAIKPVTALTSTVLNYNGVIQKIWTAAVTNERRLSESMITNDGTGLFELLDAQDYLGDNCRALGYSQGRLGEMYAASALDPAQFPTKKLAKLLGVDHVTGSDYLFLNALVNAVVSANLDVMLNDNGTIDDEYIWITEIQRRLLRVCDLFGLAQPHGMPKSAVRADKAAKAAKKAKRRK